MNNQEKFQKTFEKVCASPDVLTEVLNMTSNEKVIPIKKKRFVSKFAAVAATLAVIIGTGSIAYAKDVGGIQRVVQIWVHGYQTNATWTIEDGTYTLDYEDTDEKEVKRSGGGVAFNEDGTERPLTEEELWDEANAPEVVYEEDGSVWVYYLDQKIDITDKFEDNICYLKLEVGDQVQYLTIKYQNGYGSCPDRYLQPGEFN